jgi:hypothetical protein
MAQQGKKKKKKKRTWWVDLPVAAGLVAVIAVYSRHYPPLQQGRALVIIAIATVLVIAGLGLVNRAARPRRQQPQRRSGYRRASDR